MKIYWKYLVYVLKHKWYVMLECFKEGLYLQGIIHDLNKFIPSYFIAYARYFKGNILRGRDNTGYYKPYNTKDTAFDMAVFHHVQSNKHHWQYWVKPKDRSGYILLEIPEKYVREMICDWKGAGRAQGTPNVKEWYKKNRKNLQLEYNTRYLVERLLLRNQNENIL